MKPKTIAMFVVLGIVPGAVVVGTGFGCRVHVPALRNAGFTVRALLPIR